MRNRTIGPLGKRLFVAFLVVAMTSVLVLTAAAFIGTAQGLNSAEAQRRQTQSQVIADRLAVAASPQADGSIVWPQGAVRALAAADAFHVAFVVRDANGNTSLAVGVGGNGMGAGLGMMGGLDTTGGRWTNVDVIVGGATVGSVSVRFATPLDTSAQTIAWTWIIAAAIAALLAALLVAWFVSRRIAQPLNRLAHMARKFATGDRSVRADTRDSGASWELGELARAFDATADDVVRSEEARRRISADVAHELRTPLAALQAGLEELRDGLVTPDPERLAALHAQSVRLSRVVGDLAALSAAETAALSLHRAPTDLRALAADALLAAQPALDAAGIRSTVKPGPSVVVAVDADRVHQALGNLLANAARYCRHGDAVQITVSVQGHDAVLTVADSGPGISAHELPRVFDRLWRGSTASDVAGSGIGLAVVRELIAAHGGTVDVESDGVQGTTFTVRIPHNDPR